MNHELQSDEIDIVDYIKVIYKRWKVIAAVVLITMLFSGISSLMKPKMYEAQATFFPLSTQLSPQQSMQLEGVVIQPQLDTKDLIVSILESRKMASRVVDQLGLKSVGKEKLTRNLEKSLKSKVKITFAENGLIKLSVRDKNPEFSAKIANAYVDNLEYFNQELDLGVWRQVVQIIDRAVVPEQRMPRSIKKNVLLAGITSFAFALFLVFFLEFIQKSNIIQRLKEN